jgi:dephospho-CoA kinase
MKLVIGLTGQVCAGKSAVAGAFGRLGATLYDADKCVHELYRQPEVIAQVRSLFGGAALNANGEVDRKALGKIVFGDTALLQRLTKEVIFPRTGRAIEAEIGRFRASDAPMLLLDAPTLFESGRSAVCDKIVFVCAPLSRRLAWAKARGWDENELRLRDMRLQDEQAKRRRAAVVIDNAGTLDDLDRQVWEVCDAWRNAETAQA